MQGEVPLLKEDRIAVAAPLAQDQVQGLVHVADVVDEEAEVNVVVALGEARGVVLDGGEDVDVAAHVVGVKVARGGREVAQRGDLKKFE
jgi:hypothetical protein